MKWLLLSLLLGAGAAQASADFSSGDLYRSAGVPPWGHSDGSNTQFTIMLWVWGPNVTGSNDFFNADDGSNSMFVTLGSAFDSPSDMYFYTPNGEWHYNKDGSTTANPPQAFNLGAGWTFLAVTYTEGAATRMYAWQAGVNGGNMVALTAQDNFSALGGGGRLVNKFLIGDRSANDEGCECLIGPVYVYDGVALSRAQVEAQRQQLQPVQSGGLIVFSPFDDPATLTQDHSNTANWNIRGSVRYNPSNPPVVRNGSTAGGVVSGPVGEYGGGGSLSASLIAILGLGTLARSFLARR